MEYLWRPEAFGGLGTQQGDGIARANRDHFVIVRVMNAIHIILGVMLEWFFVVF